MLTPVKTLWRLFPALKEVVKATKKRSAGGKRITKVERKRIIRAFLGSAEGVLDDALAELEAK